MGVSRRAKTFAARIRICFGRNNNWPTICGGPQVTIAGTIAATMAGPIAIYVRMNYWLNWLANN